MSNLEEHEAEQARITAECESGECDHAECGETEGMGMECPKCGQTGEFMIAATIWGMQTSEGFDQDDKRLPDHDSDYDQYAGCICPKCGKEGVVEDFLT